MKVFFDTSAFAKRYIEEPGSDEVARICLQADQLVLSIICLPELLSTLNRLVREKKLQPGEYQETVLTPCFFEGRLDIFSPAR